MAAVTRDAPTPTSETYETLMKVSWNFDYESQVEKLDDLYNRAKENQWNATDLNWDTPIDPSSPLIASQHSQYARMLFFSEALAATTGNLLRALDRAAAFAVSAR